MNSPDTPELLARRFHEAYERLAPQFGYHTRPETRAFDQLSPNGLTMIAVCAELLAAAPMAVEAVAQAIYEQWSIVPGWVPWADGGNSHKQDEARSIARAALAQAAPIAQAEARRTIVMVEGVENGERAFRPASPESRPIGQFYPGMTAEESEWANERYYGKERREQVSALLQQVLVALNLAQKTMPHGLPHSAYDNAHNAISAARAALSTSTPTEVKEPKNG